MPRVAPLPLLGFAGVILLGGVALLLPAAHHGELGVLDALFTSTSATCVTGLVVRDTGADFTRLGQWIILIQIQIGGLGVMTISSLFGLMLKRSLSATDRELLEMDFAGSVRADLRAILRSVLVTSVLLEGVGWLLLRIGLGQQLPPDELWFQSLFLSVSAFCNAGFAPWPDSLMSFQGSLLVNLVVIVLVTIGGLGFLVQYDLYSWVRRKGPRGLGLHSRVVLVSSGLLTVGGALLVYAIERPYALAGMDRWHAAMASLFQSMTTRTAGFNSMDIAALRSPVLFLMLLLMFVGASPGSTGGGIKTSTLAVLFASVRARLWHRDNVNLFRRSLPEPIIQSAQVVATASFFVLVASIFALSLSEAPAETALDHERFFALMFEATSALGTVGLSLGVTPTLSVSGKLIVCALMFIGRLGPVTLALAFALKSWPRHGADVRYAEEGVMVG